MITGNQIMSMANDLLGGPRPVQLALSFHEAGRAQFLTLTETTNLWSSLGGILIPKSPVQATADTIRQALRSLEWRFGSVIPRDLLETTKQVLRVILDRARANMRAGRLPETALSPDASDNDDGGGAGGSDAGSEMELQLENEQQSQMLSETESEVQMESSFKGLEVQKQSDFGFCTEMQNPKISDTKGIDGNSVNFNDTHVYIVEDQLALVNEGAKQCMGGFGSQQSSSNNTIDIDRVNKANSISTTYSKIFLDPYYFSNRKFVVPVVSLLSDLTGADLLDAENQMNGSQSKSLVASSTGMTSSQTANEIASMWRSDVVRELFGLPDWHAGTQNSVFISTSLAYPWQTIKTSAFLTRTELPLHQALVVEEVRLKPILVEFALDVTIKAMQEELKVKKFKNWKKSQKNSISKQNLT